MATLDTLGEELAGMALQWLPSKDLKAARQACRLFDAASRTQLESARVFPRLSSSNTRKGTFPNWSRFPRLKALTMFGGGITHQGDQLNWHECFDLTTLPPSDQQQARASLANVTYLELNGVSGPPVLLATMLQHVPNVSTLCLYTRSADSSARLAALCALSPLPHLKVLTMCWPMERDHAACLTERLPNLKGLTFEATVADYREYPDDEREEARAEVWVALPCPRLTSLHLSSMGEHIPLPIDHSSLSLPWLQMRELHDVQLPFGLVEQFAAGLPNLVVLVAEPTGVWAPHLQERRARDAGPVW